MADPGQGIKKKLVAIGKGLSVIHSLCIGVGSPSNTIEQYILGRDEEQ